MSMSAEPLTNEKYRIMDLIKKSTVDELSEGFQLKAPSQHEWDTWETYCLEVDPKERLPLNEWLKAHREKSQRGV